IERGYLFGSRDEGGAETEVELVPVAEVEMVERPDRVGDLDQRHRQPGSSEQRREARDRGRQVARDGLARGGPARGGPRLRPRRRSASDSSRVRFEVRMTCGGCVALMVPISGIVTCQSEKTSSMNASNSSSARSVSSTRSTGAWDSCVSACSSGRRKRKGSEKISCSLSDIARLLCPASSSLMCRSCFW